MMGSDFLLSAGGQKGRKPVEIVAVGEGQPPIAETAGGGTECRRRGSAPQQGIVGVGGEGEHGKEKLKVES